MATVLFDFDLTLADSSRGAIECVNYALRGLGLDEVDEERALATIGLSLPAALEHLLGSCDATLVAEYSRRFVQRADEVMVGLTRLYEPADGVVRELRSAGCRLGIASTKFRYRIREILERDGLLDCFDVIVGGEDTDKHKPDPHALQLALARLHASPAESVYVGDHPVDARAAAAAGVPFIATLTGRSGADAFSEFAPVAVIPDLGALPAALGSPLV